MFEKIKSVASNARNAINRKLVSVQSYVMAEAPNVLTSKAGNRFLGGCLAVSAAVVPVMAKPGDTTGAGGTGLVTQMQQAMDNVYGIMKGVGIVVAAIGVAMSAFQLFLGGDKGMEKAKKTIIYTAVGCGILFLAVPITSAIANMFSGSNDQFTSLNQYTTTK